MLLLSIFLFLRTIGFVFLAFLETLLNVVRKNALFQRYFSFWMEHVFLLQYGKIMFELVRVGRNCCFSTYKNTRYVSGGWLAMRRFTVDRSPRENKTGLFLQVGNSMERWSLVKSSAYLVGAKSSLERKKCFFSSSAVEERQTEKNNFIIFRIRSSAIRRAWRTC